jgi:mannose-1-phosphate guanylyltransferase
MKALILAAGRGSRLGKLTDNLPKPLVEVKNKPVIDYLIRKLIALNVSEIFINTHYKHELIEKFVLDSNYGAKINLIYEPKLLGTAGTLKNLINNLSSEDFIVMHADNYFQDDLKMLKQKHLATSSDYLITLGTFIVSDPEKFGTLELTTDNNVINFFEKKKNSPSNIANSAIYFMKPGVKEAVDKLGKDEKDISLHLIPSLLGKIKAFGLTGFFYDIGTPENLLLANKNVQSKI